MFLFRAVLFVSLVAMVVPSDSLDPVAECLRANVQRCEASHRQAVSQRNNVNSICKATQDLIQCAEIECGGVPWDPTDDYLTHFVNFMDVTGFCSSPSLSSECARRVNKNCLGALQGAITCGETDPCRYYGMYARCIIDAYCRGDTVLLDFQDKLVAQVRANMPTKFGDEVIDLCPNWRQQIPVFDENCDFMSS